jgi:arylsulfatase A-like enzyme
MQMIADLPPSALAYIHLYPPHHPYAPRREFLDAMQDGWQPVAKPPAYFLESVTDEFEQSTRDERRKYDAYIATIDAEFGRLLDFMERTGILERNYVVLTSDHGDLYERGVVGHINEYLYEPLVRIPLIISSPGQATRQDIFSPTSSVDVVPTLLSLTGHPVPAESEGLLLPGLGGRDNPQRSVFSIDTKASSVRGPIRTATVSLRKGQYKLIAYLGQKDRKAGFELFDLQNDPEEMINLKDTKPDTLSALQHEIELKLQEVNAPYTR